MNVKILAVDDKPDNLTSLKALLSDADYEIVTALSGMEALELLEKDDFALILLDIQMPAMDGFETAKKIKQLERAKDVPIVFITAVYQEDPYVKKGFEVGAIDYFGKPFNPEILRAKVKIYTDMHRKVLRAEETIRNICAAASDFLK